MEDTTWQYVLRTSPQVYVQTGENNQPIRVYPLEKGKVFCLKKVGFTQTSTVTLNVITWWGSRYQDPMFLVTNI